ncbi:hypothetical protein [Isoptericola sp. BMS4]|uniref:hypothetical protein n=1 Tax=Isoptericola sp. BMS4 TaxID=2527875 RepID=UPI00141EAB4A|nr:hypothetical protein [Isoptericola sp. BMS4]
MWQLIAPVVRWPLYSPTRLVSVVVAVLVVTFVAGELNGDDVTPSAEVPTATASAPAATATPGAAPSGETAPAATPVDPELTASTPATAGTGTEEAGGATDALSDDPAADNPSAAAADAAAAFVAAWARPDLGAAAWGRQVRPLVTVEMWDGGLAETDPARTPDTAVAGEPVQVAINAEEGIFDVPTTSGAWIRVTVARDGEGEPWLASRVETAA